jgi:hypothetical protein
MAELDIVRARLTHECERRSLAGVEDAVGARPGRFDVFRLRRSSESREWWGDEGLGQARLVQKVTVRQKLWKMMGLERRRRR